MLEISAPPTSRRTLARPAARRGRFGVLGDAKLAGLVGLIGLVLAASGVVIAFLSWRGDERERATRGAPQAGAATATASASASAPVRASASAPAATNGTSAAARRTATATSTPRPTAKIAETVAATLSYRLEASPLNASTVKVTTAPTGRAQPGETYWFMVEVNWGDGNTDYYPRRHVGERAEVFDVAIPSDARTDVVRTGRVYALDEEQSAEAEVLRARQASTTSDNDFFAEPAGRAVSNGERLPF